MYHSINATIGVMFQPWNTATIIAVPPLPQILSEWAAVIPLVCHLASYKRDYELIGQLALSGHLWVDIFPKLGVLYSLSKLLKRGAEFIDQASTQRSPSWTVWDVCWGSVFPCANGGASSMIIRHIIQPGCAGETMPDKLPSPIRDPEFKLSPKDTSLPTAKQLPARSDSAKSSSSGDTLVNEQTPNSRNVATSNSSGSPVYQISENSKKKPSQSAIGHRRMQTLHVLQFSTLIQRRPCVSTLNAFMSSRIWHVVLSIFFLGVTVTLIALGLYGTAVILASGTVAKLSCRAVKIERPPGYLQSNETEKQSFMVMGLHQNTCTWYLFTGNRGIVDSILNKSMVAINCSSASRTLAWVLRGTHTIQLIATTYVAGAKGWDGVALVLLMLINSLGRWTADEYFMVKRWMNAEGIAVKSKSFNFTGRTMLLGAIQDISRSQCVSWMDNVISPHPRREAWLARLRLLGRKDAQGSEEILHNASGHWSEHDWKCIVLSSELAHMSAEVLRKEFPGIESA